MKTLRPLVCLLLVHLAVIGSARKMSAAESSSDVKAGFTHWQRGQVNAAQALARKALKTRPGESAARHLMVLTTFANGQYQEGLQHFAQIDPAYGRLKELTGLVIHAYRELRRFDLAAAFAKKSGSPDHIVNWLEQLHARPMKVTLSKTTVVPFAKDNLIRKLMRATPITINGRTYLGHLDTGGAYVAMSPKMAKELKIETSFIGKGRANAQATTIHAGIANRLKIGGAVIQNVPAIALPSLAGALRRIGRIEDLVILGGSARSLLIR